ncbi:hypothetical protein H012_gp035 [Acanthamoeba polyphaga moumouvirus]|uniref:Transcription factor zinc-finger domain-containing protein n=1 Tax=Acanthamoeba polyphaga moumouvirus TaxID=1269028 RepID=L7RE53_9VIRU|nr:hypothetical protein H012_gp035 [Acanthamoeba polyphaga moumouvirus]AGC02413.1 hypothetical protein Moumou_00898 [Acanthamoeba polyphaga moumouvirus]
MQHNYETGDEQAFCPICSSGYRYFYTLAVANNNVILICDECESVWLEPENIGFEDAVSNETLEEKFKVTNCKTLFDESIAGWSTIKDIKNSHWNIFAKENKLFIFAKRYNLDKEVRYPFSYLFNKTQ